MALGGDRLGVPEVVGDEPGERRAARHERGEGTTGAAVDGGHAAVTELDGAATQADGASEGEDAGEGSASEVRGTEAQAAQDLGVVLPGGPGLAGDDLAEHGEGIRTHPLSHLLWQALEDVGAGHEHGHQLVGHPGDHREDAADVERHRGAGATGHRGDDDDERGVRLGELAEGWHLPRGPVHLRRGLGGRQSTPRRRQLLADPRDPREGQHPADCPALPGAILDRDEDRFGVGGRPRADRAEAVGVAQLLGDPCVDERVRRAVGRAGDVAATLVDHRAEPRGGLIGRLWNVDVDELPAAGQVGNAVPPEVGAQLVHEVHEDRPTRAAATDEQDLAH